jgi:hypothetical protein
LPQQAFKLLQQDRGSLSLGHVEINQGRNFDRQTNVGREKKDRHVGFDPAHVTGHFATMHARHGIVEDDGFYRLSFKERKSTGSVDGSQNLISGALKQNLPDLEPDEFIINAENKVGVR